MAMTLVLRTLDEAGNLITPGSTLPGGTMFTTLADVTNSLGQQNQHAQFGLSSLTNVIPGAGYPPQKIYNSVLYIKVPPGFSPALFNVEWTTGTLLPGSYAIRCSIYDPAVITLWGFSI